MKKRLVALACLLLSTAPVLRAAEIVLEPGAVQKLVKQSLFKDRGRMMLVRGGCAVWLAEPVVAFAGKRVQVSARLAGRLGLDTGNGCAGADIASPVRISGVPAAVGGAVRLQDLRVDVSDPAARDLLDQLGISSLLPTVVDLDVRGAVQNLLTQSGSDVQATVERFDFQDVSLADGRLAMKFDFRLLGR